MKAHLLKILLCLCLLIVPRICRSESLIRINDFLATAAKDESLLVEQETLSFLQQPADSSFINEVEFRLNIEQFDSDHQQFALRLKPRGWTEIQNEKRLQLVTRKSHQAQYALLLHQALKKRYISVLDYLYYTEILTFYQELIDVYQDCLNVFEQYSLMSDTDPIKLSYNILEAENDLLRMQMEEKEVKKRINVIAAEINGYWEANRLIAFDKEKIAGMDRILAVIQQITLLPAEENVNLGKADWNYELTTARYDLEKSKNSTWLSFIETAYDLDQKDDFDKAFSFKIGISRPMGATASPEIKTLKLQSLKAKTSYEIQGRQIQENIESISQDLRQLIPQYEVFLQQKESGKIRSLYNFWQQTEGTDPLLLLKLRGSMLKNELIEKQLLHQIYSKYTALLDSSGKLSEKPLINYLCDEKELL